MTTAAAPVRPSPDPDPGLGSVEREGEGEGGPGPTSGRPRTSRWRLPAILVGVVLLGGLLIAWLQPGQPAGYLDPGNTGPQGGHALADILAQRGEHVTAVTAPSAAQQAAGEGRGEGTGEGATILVTNPELLTSAQLASLANTRASIVLVDPDQAALAALAPGVTIAGQAAVATLDPGCALPAATEAGNADMGGTLLDNNSNATACYPVSGHPSLVQVSTPAHQVTILGTGTPLTNQDLASHGNAALALNLLQASNHLVWLTPASSPAGEPVTSTGTQSFTSLIPEPVYMLAAELGIAVVLLALWRVRRLGPVVPERLPAVVRAAETTEGHGRLYHARRSRDQAAKHLREAAIGRLRPVLGLPPDATPQTVARTLAEQRDQHTDDIGQTLAGPAPEDDAALVALADKLDELERKAGIG